MGFDYIDSVTGEQETEHSGFDNMSSGPFPVLIRGVVVDVLNDPAALSEKKLIEYTGSSSSEGESKDEEDAEAEETLIQNEEYFWVAPRNSIVVRIITDGRARVEDKVSVAYPIFPPYICQPLKPGEQVWLLDSDPASDSDLLYWLCRVMSPNFVDGVNYTHYDRVFLESGEKLEQKGETPLPTNPKFPNGLETIDTYTLGPDKDYEIIFANSFANKYITFEPAPRFTKRPSDLVLQGSNNALICLGEDRGYTTDFRPKKDETDPSLEEGSNVSNANKMPDGKEYAPKDIGKGTIDIVVGRGQSVGTKPNVIKNSRDLEETNKNPINYGIEGKNNWYVNPAEGDPDFVDDAGRIYVSMKTTGDPNFGLEYPVFAGAKEEVSKPYIIAKSDEVRVIGRQQGSVRIMKEGAVAGDLCVVTMVPDDGGTLAMDANKILVGDGRTSQIYLGDDKKTEIQPIVLGQNLKFTLDSTHDVLMRLFHPTIGLGFGGLTVGYMWGHPGYPVIAAPGFTSIMNGRYAETQQIKSLNPEILSKVAFVEPEDFGPIGTNVINIPSDGIPSPHHLPIGPPG